MSDLGEWDSDLRNADHGGRGDGLHNANHGGWGDRLHNANQGGWGDGLHDAGNVGWPIGNADWPRSTLEPIRVPELDDKEKTAILMAGAAKRRMIEKYSPLFDEIKKAALESVRKYEKLSGKIFSEITEMADRARMDVERRPDENDEVIEYWTRQLNLKLVDMLEHAMPELELSNDVLGLVSQPDIKKSSKLKRMHEKTSGHGKKSFYKKPHWESDGENDYQ
jgi:Txe/YoeB family toxin of Txe-Axe toxin-antitoxin module